MKLTPSPPGSGTPRDDPGPISTIERHRKYWAGSYHSIETDATRLRTSIASTPLSKEDG